MQKVNILKNFCKKSVCHSVNEHPNFKKEPFHLHFIEGTFQSAIDCSNIKIDTLHHVSRAGPENLAVIV